MLEPGKHARNCSLEEVILADTSDTELIKELTRRGYRVEMTGQARGVDVSVATSFGTLKAVPGEEPDIVPEIRVFLQREDGKQQTATEMRTRCGLAFTQIHSVKTFPAEF